MATVANMIGRIRDNANLAAIPVPASGDLRRRLELCHQRIAQELQMPKRYIKGVDATAAFNLPSEARPSGLLYAEMENENTERSREIPLMTVQEANDLGIPWDTTDADLSEFRGHPRYGRKLIIYDPINVSAPVYPLGFDTGDTLRLLYVMTPSPLAAKSDVPFEGELPEYAGDLLVQYVTFELMMAAGKEQGQAFYNDYRRLMEQALAHTHPPFYMPRNMGVEAPS